MNRITAILLAMVALLVHMLVVHRNGQGAFGAPYDSAHAAFRLGRNLIHEGGIYWSLDPLTGAREGGLGSYPSPLLIWLSAILEWIAAATGRGLFAVTRGVQIVGMGCVMGTVFLLTRFDTDRNAGVIPALLLVFTGAVAAAGASGTEWPLAMFALALSFVTLEHGRSRFAAFGLTALVLSSPVGVACAATLFVQSLLLTLSRRRSLAVERSGRRRSLLAFLPAGFALALAHLAGASLLTDLGKAMSLDAAVLTQGLARLRDFGVVTASFVLLLFPLVALTLGELSGVGRRTLALAAVAAATTVALGGGAAESFGLAFTPALAMSFIAIQQGMARALDTYRRNMERGVWLSIAAVLLITLFASRFPGDLGQIKVERVQKSMYQAHADRTYGGLDLLGRSALFNEIRLTEQLRSIGVFLRDRLPEDTTVMSPWPGAIGYLSRHRVIDLFGRTAALTGGERQLWSFQPAPVDMEAALAFEPDYILPTAVAVDQIPSGQLVDLLPTSLFDSSVQSPGALRTSLQARLARYEIVVTAAIPPLEVRRPISPGNHSDRSAANDRLAKPWVLFRKRGIQSAPRLSATERSGYLEIRCGFNLEAKENAEAFRKDGAGHEPPPPPRGLTQVFDAVITLRLQDGSQVLVDPTGRAKRTGASTGNPEEGDARSITGMVIDPSWEDAVTIARIPLAVLRAGSEGTGTDPSPPRSLEVHLFHHTLVAPSGAGLSSAEAAEPLRFPLR